MAGATYSIDIQTQAATRAIDALKNQLGSLTTAFGGIFAADQIVKIAARFEDLRVSLGILYKDAARGAQVFDQIKTLAGQSVFSVDDLTESWIKLKSSGIEPTSQQLQLFADVSSVAADSVGALRAITDLYARTTAGGLGLEDLNRLADRGIPVFNILARTMGLSRLEVAKFGQSADGAQKILKVLEVELQKTFGGASEARAKTLGQAMNQVSDAFKNLIDRASQAGPGGGLAESLRDIAKFLNEIDVNQINTIIQNIKNLVIAFAGIFVIGKIAGLFETLTRAMGVAAASGRTLTQVLSTKTGVMATAASGLLYLKQAFDINTAATVASYTNGNKFIIMIKDLFAGVGRVLPVIGNLIAAFYALDSALVLMTGRDIKGWFDEAAAGLENLVRSNLPALADMLDKIGEKLGMAPAPSVVRENQAEIDRLKKRADAAKQMGDANEQAAKPIVEQNYALDRLKVTYALLSTEMFRYTDSLKNRMGFEAGIIGMTEDQIELETKLREEAERYQRSVQELKDKQVQLAANMIGEKDVKKVQEYQLEIDLIAKLIKDASDAHLKNRDAIQQGVDRIQSARLAEQDRLRTLELITQELERQMNKQGALRDAILEAQSKLSEEQYKKTRPLGLLGQIEDIKRANKLAAEEAGRSYAALFDTEEMTTEQAEELASGLNRIAEIYGRISGQQISNLEDSRTWGRGWQEAFAQYAETAMNSANQAKTYFETFTRGVEDALVNFARTGKLSFKDLANNIIADIIRINTRMALTDLFGGKSGGFGIFDAVKGIGSAIFGGRATGGPVTEGRPYLVGERGREMFVPDSNGRIMPIDGQREAVSVTYNINATDASSFKQLLARDPEFLFAVTESARKKLPSRSRR